MTSKRRRFGLLHWSALKSTQWSVLKSYAHKQHHQRKKGADLRGSKVEDVRNTGDMGGAKGKGK